MSSRRRNAAKVLGIIALLSLGGSAARAAQPDAAADLTRLREMDATLLAVGFRLAKANAELCDRTAPFPGLALHEIADYGARLAPEARRLWALGDRPAVQAVAPGSAADVAGVKPGDVIVDVDGEPLVGDALTTLRLIKARLASGPVRVGLRRDGAERSVTLQPDMACDLDLLVRTSRAVDGSSGHGKVVVNSALLDFVRSDDELAVVIGHEMAHAMLGAMEGAKARELAADRIGLYLAARAGYDVSVAPAFWRRMERSARLFAGVRLTHPGPDSRARQAEWVAAEINSRRLAGGALVPDLPRKNAR